MIDRRTMIGIGLVLGASVAAAQQTVQVYRIGVLETVPRADNRANIDAFTQEFARLGYTEDHNYVMVYRSADGATDRFALLAHELLQAKVDVIITRGTPAALAAKQATAILPIVMASSGDPVGTGLVASLSRPGGNITGLSAFSTELAAKQVELAKDLLPDLARLGYLANMSNPVSAPQWAEVQRGAAAMGIDAHLLDARLSPDLPRLLGQAADSRLQVIIVAIDTVTQANRSAIVELARKHRLPTIFSDRTAVDIGGLLSHRIDYTRNYQRAAHYVDKVLHGARPADLPIEQPTLIDTVVNLKTAREIGLDIPKAILIRANEVIE
jgi:putative tryptophan/tyrosine transport system substrate-binding protein